MDVPEQATASLVPGGLEYHQEKGTIDTNWKESNRLLILLNILDLLENLAHKRISPESLPTTHYRKRKKLFISLMIALQKGPFRCEERSSMPTHGVPQPCRGGRSGNGFSVADHLSIRTEAALPSLLSSLRLGPPNPNHRLGAFTQTTIQTGRDDLCREN